MSVRTGADAKRWPWGERSHRRLLLVLGLILVGAALLVSARAAEARQHTIYRFDLYETVTTYPGVEFTRELHNPEFRWYVDTAHSTRVSVNWTRDYSYFEAADIPAHNQSWRYFTQDLFWTLDQRWVFRGRSLRNTQLNRSGYFRF